MKMMAACAAPQRSFMLGEVAAMQGRPRPLNIETILQSFVSLRTGLILFGRNLDGWKEDRRLGRGLGRFRKRNRTWIVDGAFQLRIPVSTWDERRVSDLDNGNILLRTCRSGIQVGEVALLRR